MNDDFETRVELIAQHLPYPPTPVLRRPAPRLTSSRPRWRQALAALLLLGLSGLLIPDIRAAIVEFFQIGVVRVYLDGSSTSGEPLDLEQVSGETTLNIAQTLVRFPILIPPDDSPDRVFVQGESMVIFVWIKEGKIENTLYQTTTEDWMIIKKEAKDIQFTSIAGEEAFWMTLDHPVEFIRNGVVQTELTHFVTGRVLVWERKGVTYRLETHMSLDEARQFAESLIVLE